MENGLKKAREELIDNPRRVNITQEKSGSSSWMYYEIIGIGGLIWGLSDSWIYGIVVAMIGLVLMHIPILGYIMCYFLGILWGIAIGGFLGYFIGNLTIGSVIGVILCFVISTAHVKARKKVLADE